MSAGQLLVVYYISFLSCTHPTDHLLLPQVDLNGRSGDGGMNQDTGGLGTLVGQALDRSISHQETNGRILTVIASITIELQQ